MKKFMLLAFCTLFFFAQADAQKIGTRKATISFHSDAKLEQIKAVNKTASFVIDTQSKKIQLAVLVKGFLFKKALMQEHFNENYMESSKFPKATFKGKFVDDIDFSKAGPIQTSVTGNLTLHGVTHEVTVPATITQKGDLYEASANFDVVLADYGIKIPSMVKGKIAKTVQINVAAELKKL